MPVTLECKRCNEPFTVKDRRKNDAKYCSRQCANRRHLDKGETAFVTSTCKCCEERFRHRRSDEDREYCSDACKYWRVELFGVTVMKKCRECGVELAIEEFPRSGEGGRKSLCPDCYLEHERERYQQKRKRYQREGYDIPEDKHCGSCGRTLPIDEFRLNLGSKDKHHSQCKECCAEYERQYHQEHREEILEYQRQWHSENDPGNKWAIERKKRERNLDGDYDSDDVRHQWHRQNGECFWCGKRCGTQPQHHGEYQVDHLTPVSRPECKPTDNPRNLVIACAECNISKGAKLPIEFKRYRLKHKDADKTYSQGCPLELS